MSTASPVRISLTALLLAALFGSALWLFTWSPETFPTRLTSPTATGHYGALTDAYRAGQLHLQQRPDPRLVALADPYDPAQNAPYRVNDLSYFEGKYYLYHGSAPAVVLLLPFRLLTGSYLTEPGAALVFCLTGALFSLLILARVMRVAAPRASLVALFTAAVAVLAGSGHYIVLRGSTVNHVAIAAAYGFLMIALWALSVWLTSPRPSRWWLGLASAAFGLAVASRPNYLFGSAVLLLPIALQWRDQRAQGGRFPVTSFAAVASPLVAIVLLMLTHNGVRFGAILEFGQTYMLGGWDQRSLGFFSFNPEAMIVSLRSYLVGGATFSADFPFVTATSWQAVGALIQSPFIVFVLAAGAITFIPRGGPDSGVVWLLRTLAVVAICNLAVLVLLPSGKAEAGLINANARYTFDFLPVSILAAALGLILAADRLAHHRSARRVLLSTSLLTAILTVVAALSLDLQRLPSESYRQLAQVLNQPHHLLRNWLGTIHGPIRMEIIFPAGRTGRYEPLVATGTDAGGDLVYVHYDSPETLRFGLVGTTMRGPLSPPIPIKYGEPHQLEIRMGSLYPPVGHPKLASLSDAEVGRLKRSLQIELDGKVVAEFPAHFFPSSSRQVRVGSTEILRSYCEEIFTGEIRRQERAPMVAPPAGPDADSGYGPLRLTLRFPTDKKGQSEPLVVSGLPGAGDFVYVTYVDDQHITIGIDHWGYGGHRTIWLPIDYSVNHTVEILMGSLLPPAGHVDWGTATDEQIQAAKTRVRLVLDREVVLDTEQATYDSSPYDVFVGRNAIGGSTCNYAFTGEIRSATRLPLPMAASPPSGTTR